MMKPSAKDRRWKRVEGRPHLERSVDQYGVRTRCRECKRRARGYDAEHYSNCPHGAQSPGEPGKEG